MVFFCPFPGNVQFTLSFSPYEEQGGGVILKSRHVTRRRGSDWRPFCFQQVVGGKLTAMDSKGNKVLVCDNGTGVSQTFG